MEVRLATLGNPSVHLGDEALPSLPGKPVSFGLLAFLGVEREATRDRLIGTFWPEVPQERARKTLSQALYELRKELGEAWMESSGNVVRATEALRVDLEEFVALAEEGRHAEGLDLYDGHFLDGVPLAQTHAFEEWVDLQRARVARRFRASVDGFIGACRGRGELEEALRAAWKWVSLDPLDDGGQHALIQLLAETGSRTEALAQFERYEAILKVELGLEPLESTKTLVQGIRSGALEVPSPPPDHYEILAGGLRDSEYVRVGLEADPLLEYLRPIGKGTMAEVFLAREEHLKRLVAVKVLFPDLRGDHVASMRFQREAQSAGRLTHPHVCTVHRVGALPDGTPYFVCPFIKGTTLGQHLKAEGRLEASEVRRVVREISSALAAAHRLGIIHRDVRPDNILREDETGIHYLCDFGLAGVLESGERPGIRLTRTGEILGDPAYIGPEQMRGSPLTDRTDVYSLGVLAHELLTGHCPPVADDVSGGRAGDVLPPDLRPLEEYLGETDSDLLDLIRRCLAAEPTHRPSAADISRKCEEHALAPTPEPPPVRGPARNFIEALIERRFLHIIGAYIAGSWILLEATDQLEGRDLLPELAYPLALTTVVFGFAGANILAWYHGRKGRQDMTRPEIGLLGLVVVGWAVACVIVLS